MRILFLMLIPAFSFAQVRNEKSAKEKSDYYLSVLGVKAVDSALKVSRAKAPKTVPPKDKPKPNKAAAVKRSSKK